MPKELGDSVYGTAIAVNEESDGTNLSAGDAVTQDGNQQVTPTGDGDDLYGIVMRASGTSDLSDLSAGDEVVVAVGGDVIGNAGGSITRGDVAETTATSGRLGQNSTGTEQDVDEGGSATYTLAVDTAKALSNSGGTVRGHSLGANEAHFYLG
jgi:hypothetical protein